MFSYQGVKMLCRGEKCRERIAEEYNLKAVAHVGLLAGQKKLSCTNVTLTDRYYCFSYESKKGAETGTFFCGSYAANHFLKLTDSSALPLFNPLVSENPLSVGNVGGANDGNQRRSWDPIAKQLHNAINMIVVCWDIIPSSALSNIKEQIDRFYFNSPYPTEIKAVNTIISKDFKGRTLQEMIDELRANNDIRNFDFGYLNSELEKIGVESNYG